MKLIDLFEEVVDVQNMDQMRELIIRDCQPFLQESNHALFRGIKRAKAVFQKRDVPKTRLPIDTPKFIHSATDKLMKKLGFKARRDNSIFTAKSPSWAAAYGRYYAIFPIGEYFYTYSNSIQDFYVDLISDRIDEILTNEALKLYHDKLQIPSEKQKIHFNIKESEIDQKKLFKIIKNEYTTTNINEAHYKSEIMISCESYYAVDTFDMKFFDLLGLEIL